MTQTATITAIREGIAANIDAAIDDVQVSPFLLSSPTPPTIQVMPSRIDYDKTMGHGSHDAQFTVQMIVGAPGDKAAQLALDQHIAPHGPRSVKVAIESDPTLGGIAEDLHVTDVTGYQTFTFEGRPPMLGCSWSVWVMIGAA